VALMSPYYAKRYYVPTTRIVLDLNCGLNDTLLCESNMLTRNI
jgi:hypothetical protein